MQHTNRHVFRHIVPIRWAAFALVLPLACAQGCMAGKFTGVTGTAAGDVSASSNPNSDMSVAAPSSTHLPMASACTTAAPAPRGLRRLTRVELNNTLQDLLGDANAPQSTSLFSGDARVYGFDNVQTSLAVRDNQALVLSSFAETVGTFAATKSATLSPCQTWDAACRTTFIQTFGRKAFRAPLTAGQIADYETLMATAPDLASGIKIVVTAMVQSPYFLYRSELGVVDASAGGLYRLTPYEIATELSYMLTGTMPDTMLQAAADANTLDAAGIRAQGERLLATPRAHDTIDRFFMEWLQVGDLDLQARSEGTDVLSPAIKTAMQQETKAFVDDTVFAQKGSYQDLLGRDVTFMAPELAQFYTGGAVAAAVPAVTSLGLASTRASAAGRLPGVLGHGGVLAAASQPTYASPTLRGRMLRMRLLCGSVPAPPPGIPPLPAASGAQTLRQRFVAHTKGASCASCHDLMDPLAFPLGGYDTLGRARAGGMEGTLPLDLSGAVTGIGEADVSVTGGTELVAALSKSPAAAACLARHWTMYALGRLSWPEDTCTFDEVAQGAAAQKNNVQSMLLALTTAKSFTVRTKD